MIALLLLLVSISSAWSFTTNHPPFSSSTRTPPPPLFLSAAPTNEEDPSTSCVDIVLFGIGDLRTTDHPGLVNAFSKNNSRVLPLLILDTQNTLPNIPMARTHTLDTAALLLAGIQSLQTQLKQLGLQLHVKTGKNAILKELLTDVLQELSARDLQNNITVHACDLGLVDRQFLGYSPLTYLLSEQPSSNDDVLFQLQTWDCHLRSNAWEDVQENLSQFPKNFVEFEQQYIHNEKVVAGNTATIPSNNKHNGDFTIDSILGIPSLEEIEELLCVAVGYDHRDKKLLECDRNTGLFVTHWGGLGVETFDETTILQALDSFLGLNGKEEEGDKALIKEFQWWSLLKSMRNELSLEHAAMNWMMKGDGDGDGTNVQTQNLIEDELLTRYLAAPLLFGMVSPRYMWNRANDAAKTKPKSLSALFPALPQSRGTVDAVKMIVESREWHTLFASKMMIEAANNEKNDDDFHIGYWRWHGFLCRYVSTSNTHRTGDDSSNLGNKKEGITLIHGFGASGNQWKKAMGALKKLSHVEGKSKVEALAPDLIGFGQSEKPSLTYTQYLWESYSAAFIKEVAIGKHNWNFFTVGGNSIGGYTAMSLAADDTVVNGNGGVSCVTASGANGSTKCKGLVLMNSAGKVFNRQDIEAMKGDRVTIAEATSSDLLGVSSPPPRQLASIFGAGLLWYLRPRIQSICKNIYPTNPAAVDDILCGDILRDSLDPGAINVMISGSKLPPPRTANELLGADFGSSKNRSTKSTFRSKYNEGTFGGPVLVAQGLLDPLNDAKGRAKMFRELRDGIKVDPINAGHCPHDELEVDVAKSISRWLTSDVQQTFALK